MADDTFSIPVFSNGGVVKRGGGVALEGMGGCGWDVSFIFCNCCWTWVRTASWLIMGACTYLTKSLSQLADLLPCA